MRRVGLSLAVLVAALVSVPVAAATSYDISASAAPATVAAGQPYDVRGAIRPAVAGAQVVLQQHDVGRWRTLATQSAAADGGFAFHQVAPRTVMALHLRVTSLGATSPTVVVYSAVRGYGVTVEGPTVTEPGVAFALNGDVSPAAPGQPVVLEELTDGTWRPVATTRLSPQSTFDFAAAGEPLGQHHFRVVKAAAGFRLAGVGAIDVVAARWHFLSDVSPTDGAADGTTVTMWQQSFPHSIVWSWLTSGSSSEVVTFDLASECVTFRATAGVDDATAYYADAVAQLGVSLDGRSAFSRSMEFGDREDLVLDVTGVDNLSLDLRQLPASDGTSVPVSAGFGDAQVLCTF